LSPLSIEAKNWWCLLMLKFLKVFNFKTTLKIYPLLHRQLQTLIGTLS
jgi:hypothetical protein